MSENHLECGRLPRWQIDHATSKSLRPFSHILFVLVLSRFSTLYSLFAYLMEVINFIRVFRRNSTSQQNTFHLKLFFISFFIRGDMFCGDFKQEISQVDKRINSLTSNGIKRTQIMPEFNQWRSFFLFFWSNSSVT